MKRFNRKKKQLSAAIKGGVRYEWRSGDDSYRHGSDVHEVEKKSVPVNKKKRKKIYIISNPVDNSVYIPLMGNIN